MNECYLLVKRISKIDFKFIINKKEKSIVRFRAKLINNLEIELFAYDDLADWVFRKQLVIFFLRGKIRTSMQIEIIQIYDFNI